MHPRGLSFQANKKCRKQNKTKNSRKDLSSWAQVRTGNWRLSLEKPEAEGFRNGVAKHLPLAPLHIGNIRLAMGQEPCIQGLAQTTRERSCLSPPFSVRCCLKEHLQPPHVVHCMTFCPCMALGHSCCSKSAASSPKPGWRKKSTGFCLFMSTANKMFWEVGSATHGPSKLPVKDG